MKVGSLLRFYNNRFTIFCPEKTSDRFGPSRFSMVDQAVRYWNADIQSIYLEEEYEDHPAELQIFVKQNWEEDLKVTIYEC